MKKILTAITLVIGLSTSANAIDIKGFHAGMHIKDFRALSDTTTLSQFYNQSCIVDFELDGEVTCVDMAMTTIAGENMMFRAMYNKDTGIIDRMVYGTGSFCQYGDYSSLPWMLKHSNSSSGFLAIDEINNKWKCAGWRSRSTEADNPVDVKTIVRAFEKKFRINLNPIAKDYTTDDGLLVYNKQALDPKTDQSIVLRVGSDGSFVYGVISTYTQYIKGLKERQAKDKQKLSDI